MINAQNLQDLANQTSPVAAAVLHFQNKSLDEGDGHKTDNKRYTVKKAPGWRATCVGQEVKLSTKLLAELSPTLQLSAELVLFCTISKIKECKFNAGRAVFFLSGKY